MPSARSLLCLTRIMLWSANPTMHTHLADFRIFIYFTNESYTNPAGNSYPTHPNKPNNSTDPSMPDNLTHLPYKLCILERHHLSIVHPRPPTRA
jgi:hypothetical protein